MTEDPNVVESSPLPIAGSITCKFNIFKSGRKNGLNFNWRLEIIKLSQISAPGKKAPCNPYCEVYWKGPAEKNELATHTSEWVILGSTKGKINTISPTFSKEKDNVIFDLPPIWTTEEIPNRGVNVNDCVKSGGWIPRKPLSAGENEVVDEIAQNTKADENKAFITSGSNNDMKQYRIVVKCNDFIIKEIQKRFDIIRLLIKAENRERVAMNNEEIQQRSVANQKEMLKYKKQLDEQSKYSKSFMQLLQFIQSPPVILTRVRYLMGEELLGGGMKVLCQDPANNQLINVYSVPILNKQDEADFCNQMSSLISKSYTHLTKVIDYAVFQVRDFNLNGFTSSEERIAIAILEYYEGPYLMDYLNDHWDVITNDIFRDILFQISEGLMNLHKEGIVHRNFGPDCITVQIPTETHNDNKVKKKISKLQNKINSRIGEYLFLHNPRQSGCSRSEGRADWGCKSTAPPEASLQNSKGITKITNKSDVYAFGSCVFYWATKGLIYSDSIDVKKTLPLKWGAWLHSLLNMCLNKKCELRASAQDIQLYLQSRFGK